MQKATFLASLAVTSLLCRPAISGPGSDSFTDPAAWEAFDAGSTGGLQARGYFGAACDGRYIYYAPCRTMAFHGVVLRYDTTGRFKSAGSWAAHDAGFTDGLRTVGYAGAVYHAPYVYFVPFADARTRHARVLRHDTRGEFTSASSWSAFDAGPVVGLRHSGFAGAVCDGRYIYFVPFGYEPYAHGSVLRYDTQGEFRSAASWRAHDASRTDGLATRGYYGAGCDGRYVYFVPFNDGRAFHGRVLRLDTRGEFDAPASWSSYDAATTDGLTTVGYKGAAWDGRYLYFVPFRSGDTCHGRVLRYDTRGEFHSPASWSAYDAGKTAGLDTRGYVGAHCDGRYVYLIPYSGDGNVFHARMLRYDTTGDFKTAASWSAYNAEATEGLPTRGYKFSASDGKYLYFVPYHNGNSFSGIALRYRLPVSPSGR